MGKNDHPASSGAYVKWNTLYSAVADPSEALPVPRLDGQVVVEDGEHAARVPSRTRVHLVLSQPRITCREYFSGFLFAHDSYFSVQQCTPVPPIRLRGCNLVGHSKHESRYHILCGGSAGTIRLRSVDVAFSPCRFYICHHTSWGGSGRSLGTGNLAWRSLHLASAFYWNGVSKDTPTTR